MDSMSIAMLATRLLELEQRFDSYCKLHEEELLEIKATMNQLRENILALNRNQQKFHPGSHGNLSSKLEESVDESSDDISLTAL